MSVPTATYRLQLHREFTLADARRLLPYLSALGISHLYLSPVFRARAGSTHGYDVIDPTAVSPELGGEAAFRALAAEARTHGMGLLVDIVPNHMAADPQNPWWRDVLRHGRASGFAEFFDIDWEKGGGQVRLPILGRHYADALDAGELRLALDDDGLELAYFDYRLPLDPATWPDVLASAADASPQLHALVEQLREIPPADAPAAEPEGRSRRSADLGRRLRRLHDQDPAVRDAIEAGLAAFDAGRAGAAAADRLDALVARQPYQPVFWQMAAQEINYRRFFDIGDLVGVRVEDPAVFDATHDLVLRWVRDGVVDGLRVDHVDGLADPTGYLRRLAAAAANGGAAYLVVEKILAPGEPIPAAWPVAGTTGYDFLNTVNGLFVDPAGMERLSQVYAREAGVTPDFPALAREEKKRVVQLLFAGEMRSLESELAALAALDRRGLDLPAPMLGRALLEVTARLPVYRTYLRPEDPPSERDRDVIERALAEAAAVPDVDATAVAFLGRVLLEPGPDRDAHDRFVLRWQQFTGPVMAKGVEDTALYNYHVLVAASEVGGNPGRPAVGVAEFHRHMAATAERHPHTMNATSTHDTKRGEDVRSRLDVLSEMPEEWEEALPRWREWNAGLKRELGGRPAPDVLDEILVYQTLLGAWPADPADEGAFAGRIREYLTKAAREAKRHTTWQDPDDAYEAALHGFATALIDGRADPRFREEFERLRAELAFHGTRNALAQLVLKATAPGVPDFYQGTELWTLTLVDPDNRRPVDYDRRERLLATASPGAPEEAGGAAAGPGGPPAALLDDAGGGRVKLWLTAATLRFRREHAGLFAEGEYLPLDVAGEQMEHVVAFARRRGSEWAVTVAPRLTARLARGRLAVGPNVWRETRVRLPEGAPAAWRNALTGGRLDATDGGLAVADALATLPVALLAAG
ncbi:MAG TPA: malto-oligosyltrehalose synthase [Longimicrobiales bacterium]|nr:malto-oligosyltrehalose synthase [Longimicrobiales bacterium]